VPEYELAEEPECDEPDREPADGADGADGAVPPEPDVPLEPDLGADGSGGAEGAWVGGTAGGVAGVNDGARSRGVKTDGLFLAESSPVSEGEAAGAGEMPLDLAIPSAGSGTAFVVESAAFSAVVTVSSLDFPLPPLTGVVSVRISPAFADPERELPVLVRDDDMELLSTTASSSATS